MADPVQTSVTIDAPPSRVLAIISDLEKPERWANEAKSADVAARDDDGRPTRIVVTLGAIGFTTTATYDATYADDGLTMECVEASLIRESTIRYRVDGDGDSTTLEMSVTMQVTVPVPQWGLDQAIRASMDKNLQSVKDDAEGA